MCPAAERPSPAKRPRIGDVLEIQTLAGRGYFQYVARDATHGPQIRVLPGTFGERPDLSALAKRKALYYVHFPLGAAVVRRLVAVVGHEPLPEPVATTRAEDELFRLQSIWNDAMLAERIAQGWTPTGEAGITRG
jgi:hypothetical protein